ncbi:MAG: DMT family transporter [Candidatus Neomarinimicrobiota bacterium]
MLVFPHLIAVLQALLVTFLWSTSFIIIKWGLLEIPPITFAGLRYVIAFVCFVPFILTRKHLEEIKRLTTHQWKKLVMLGLVFYTVTQGAQFLGLSLLPAVTVSLILNLTPLFVAIGGIFLLEERPTLLQWTGVSLFIIGMIAYFYPVVLTGNEAWGLVIMTVGVLANSWASVLGRDINRNRNISPLVVTLVSMGIGSALLLIIGLTTEGLPSVSPRSFMYLIWLAVINTAFAFTLWNVTLRTLTAMESSIINGTMLIQIAILAWVFIGEKITPIEGTGIVIAAVGAVLVQMRRNRLPRSHSD